MIEQKMAPFWFKHPTVFLTADVGWKAKLSHPSSAASFADHSPRTYMACVAWCGIGHRELTSDKSGNDAEKGAL